MSKAHASKRFRRLALLIEPHGYTIRPLQSGHNGIFNSEGRRVYTMSGTPKNPHQAMDNTLKDLKKFGLIPKEVRYK